MAREITVAEVAEAVSGLSFPEVLERVHRWPPDLFALTSAFDALRLASRSGA